MKIKRILGLVAIALFVNCENGQAAKWKRVDIYLLDWRVMPNRRVSAESLRHLSHGPMSSVFHAMTVSDPKQVDQVVRMLDLSLLMDIEGQPQDARLLVDLFDTSGHRTSFYASQSSLRTIDNRRGHWIDQHFRDYFEKITKQT
jgi:hypothetical protein